MVSSNNELACGNHSTMDLKWGNARPHGASLQDALLSLLFHWSTEDFLFPSFNE